MPARAPPSRVVANQEQIRDATKGPTAARASSRRGSRAAACVGSAEAKSKVNKSLRWSVANNIRVLTPQLFVDNVKLCDEDVDLGLEYALSIMLDKHDAGTLQPPPAEAPPPPAHEPPPPPATTKPVEPKPAPVPEAAKPPAVEDNPAVPPAPMPAETPPAEPEQPVTTPSEAPAEGSAE